MTEAIIGWGAEFWLSTDDDDANLVELSEVVKFGDPTDETELVDATHLKSEGRFKEYISGLRDGKEFDVVLNCVPRSATDQACRDAKKKGDKRAFRIFVPIDLEAGTYDQVDGFAIARTYDRGDTEAGARKEATLTLKPTGVVSDSAATRTPGP